MHELAKYSVVIVTYLTNETKMYINQSHVFPPFFSLKTIHASTPVETQQIKFITSRSDETHGGLQRVAAVGNLCQCQPDRNAKAGKTMLARLPLMLQHQDVK